MDVLLAVIRRSQSAITIGAIVVGVCVVSLVRAM